MNDYRFANFPYEKRRTAGLSQNQAARLLGVSDKAVSKWKNARRSPPRILCESWQSLWMNCCKCERSRRQCLSTRL